MLRAAITLVLIVTGCTVGNGKVAVRPIPGTEQVALYDFAISVSPDEGQMAFTEWVLPKARVFEDLPKSEYPVRIVTLNLETGDTVRHVIESVPPNALGFSSVQRGWKRLAGLEVIENRFRPPGWRGNYFYFQPYYYLAQVALDSRVPGMMIVAKPVAPGACSDCPPFTTADFRGRSWDLLSNGVSAVVREGTIRSIYYYGEGPDRTHLILRLQEEGEEQLVKECRLKKGTMTHVASLRVAPSEQYLAYVVHSKRQALLAGPREELFIRDLSSGRELKIAKYGYMSNMVWSPDSERLYFAGGEYETDSAVRIVDVAAAFAR